MTATYNTNINWKRLKDELLSDPSTDKVNSLAELFAKHLLFEDTNPDKITDCSIHAPRNHSHVDKKTRLTHKIIDILFPHSDDQKVVSYVNYSHLLRRLKKLYMDKKAVEIEEAKKMKLMENKFKTCRLVNHDKLWCELTKEPLSDKIINPTPMPVDVAPYEDLKPFFKFLSDNLTITDGAEQLGFTRGVYYSDGRIDLCKQVVGPNWIGSLMDSIWNNSNVEHFLLGNNIIDLEGASQIANFISREHKPKIKTWYLAGNCIGSDGIKLIAEALKNDKDANAVWLKRNPLKEGVKHIAEMLRVNKTIKILDLDNTGILDEGTRLLFDALKENTGLKHLYIDANGITDVGAGYIADYFRYMTNAGKTGLKSIWLSVNRLGDQGAIQIVRELAKYKPLERLTLSSNRLKADGVKVVCELLVDHPNLILLDLGHYKSTADMGELGNRMLDDGVSYVCDFIKRNKKVQLLSVANNGLTQNGINQLVDAVLQNDNLFEVLYYQYGLEIDKTIHNAINEKMAANVKSKLGFDSYQEFLSKRKRFIRHTRHVRFIDSVYRNNM